MKNDKEIEQILLNDENYEKLMKKKTEEEFTKAIQKNAQTPNIITDITKVPKDKLFSAKATYSVINKTSKSVLLVEEYAMSPFSVNFVFPKI